MDIVGTGFEQDRLNNVSVRRSTNCGEEGHTYSIAKTCYFLPKSASWKHKVRGRLVWQSLKYMRVKVAGAGA